MERLRAVQSSWLSPWEATDPRDPLARPSVAAQRRWADRSGREGTAISLVICEEGELAGQITASPILYGSQQSATIGYWVDRGRAGRGLAPRAVAVLGDHLVQEMGLHRLELTIRPENTPSLRVAQKLGLRDEGLRERAVHVDGIWRDHRVFAITAEEMDPGSGGLTLRERLRRRTGL